jgi:hypothetical protein
MTEVTGTRLAEIEKEIKTGDPLLWRPEPGDLWGRAITVGAGGAEYSHVGMAVWLQQPFTPPVLYTMDMVLGAGGVAVPLQSYLDRWPGLCDHFRVDDDRFPMWDGEAAAAYFQNEFLGVPYGKENARLAARTRLALLRWFFRCNRDDDYVAAGPPFCSGAYAEAAGAKLGGKVDPVPGLSPSYTWPGDLAESLLFNKAHEALI